MACSSVSAVDFKGKLEGHWRGTCAPSCPSCFETGGARAPPAPPSQAPLYIYICWCGWGCVCVVPKTRYHKYHLQYLHQTVSDFYQIWQVFSQTNSTNEYPVAAVFSIFG